jgi:hypothetical protein
MVAGLNVAIGVPVLKAGAATLAAIAGVVIGR